jgi:hypothetical protein
MADKEKSDVVGKTITDVRALTKAELKKEGWEERDGPVVVLVLSNGAILYPSRDPEGNGPGVLFGTKGKKAFLLSVASK